MMKSTLAGAFASLLLLAACGGDTVSDARSKLIDEAAAARIAAALDAMVADGEAKGASVLIHEKGKEVYYGAAGMADGETGRGMQRDTVVQIFSMTKPVTGVALMMLYEEGRFDLDDPLAQYAPEFANVRVYAGEDENGDAVYEAPRRPITIRDITRHTAGFATGADPGPAGDAYRAAPPLQFDEPLAGFARRLAVLPLASHPGQRWSYGDSVDVQAYLVERLSGVPFEQFLQQRIFDPLRMTETGYRLRDGQRERIARLYERGDGGLAPVPDERMLYLNTHPHALTPGGFGLVSTLDDYMRFARMLLREGELDGARLLKPETVRLMATDQLPDEITDRSWLPSKGEVGFGIDFAVRVAPPAGPEENTGAVGEYFWDGAASTLFWVDPANDLAAVFFTQHMPFNGRLHKRIRDAVYGRSVAAN